MGTSTYSVCGEPPSKLGAKQAWGQANLGPSKLGAKQTWGQASLGPSKLGARRFFCQHAPTSWADGKDSGDTPCDEFLEVPLFLFVFAYGLSGDHRAHDGNGEEGQDDVKFDGIEG